MSNSPVMTPVDPLTHSLLSQIAELRSEIRDMALRVFDAQKDLNGKVRQELKVTHGDLMREIKALEDRLSEKIGEIDADVDKLMKRNIYILFLVAGSLILGLISLGVSFEKALGYIIKLLT